MMNRISTRINGIDPTAYKAVLLDYSVGPCSFDNGYINPPRSIIPIRLKSDVGLRDISLTFDFEGKTMHEIALNISNITAMLRKEADLLLPDGFYYFCAFDKVSTPKEVAPWIMQVKYTFVGYRHGPLIKQKLPDNGVINIEGNFKAGVVYEITTEESEITINGITVRNITGTIVIDGINKVVKENGINKFVDTDLTEFPALEEGLNTCLLYTSRCV